MDFLETYSPPKLNQEEKDHLNRTIIRNEIEYAVKKKTLPTNKKPGPNGCTGEFYQTYKEELTPSFLNSSNRMNKEHSQRHSMKPPSP